MNASELSKLSPRFQAVSAIFTSTPLNSLPYSVAAAIDASPNALASLEQQLQAASGSINSVNLGASGEGTRNIIGKIRIDPNDFQILQNNPGEMALRIIHEVAHTYDPAGTVHPNNYTDPITYANARARSEGFSLNNENSVITD